MYTLNRLYTSLVGSALEYASIIQLSRQMFYIYQLNKTQNEFF